MPYQQKQKLEKSRLALFGEKQSSNDRAPIMRGTMELVLEDLKWAVAQAKENKEIKFKVSVWKGFPKGGGDAYLSGVIEKDVPYEGKKSGGIPGLDFDGPSDDISL